MTKQDTVVPEMKERLLVNKYGKLTPNQWLDLVTQPLMSLVVLCIPLMLFLPRLLIASGIWLIAVALVLGLVVLGFRAYRYARAPLHFGNFRVETPTTSLWSIVRPVQLQDSQGQKIKFSQRLCPPPQLQRGEYIAYYLKDHDTHILLSIAPANHQDINDYLPTKLFEKRFQHRQQQ